MPCPTSFKARRRIQLAELRVDPSEGQDGFRLAGLRPRQPFRGRAGFQQRGAGLGQLAQREGHLGSPDPPRGAPELLVRVSARGLLQLVTPRQRDAEGLCGLATPAERLMYQGQVQPAVGGDLRNPAGRGSRFWS